MKQGKPLIAFVMVAIFAVLAIYLGVYAFRSLQDPYRTTLVYAYTAEDSVEANGLLVREETVFPSQTGIVELTRSEGEKVGVGQLAGSDGVFQRSGQGLLPDNGVERRRTVLARRYDIVFHGGYLIIQQ